jgi:cytoskeletal protein RodZ
MRTIGQFLRASRLSQNLSLEDLSHETRIKKEFIASIEKEEWFKLPEYPVVVGFVKNIASSLALDRTQAIALLRRDYPPKKLAIAPKPDVGREFHWSPRLTFLVGVASVSLLVLGYLGFQYKKFISPPVLIVNEPKEGQQILSSPVEVKGRTDSEATLKVNNQPVIPLENGEFVTEVEVTNETREIVVKSRSRSGKETEVKKTIQVELE